MNARLLLLSLLALSVPLALAPTASAYACVIGDATVDAVVRFVECERRWASCITNGLRDPTDPSIVCPL